VFRLRRVAIAATLLAAAACVSSEPSGPGQRPKERPSSSFVDELRRIDDGELWRCAIAGPPGSRRLPVEVVEGLRKAYASSPKTQPGRLTRRCVPIADAMLQKLGALDPPWRLTDELESYSKALKEAREALAAHAGKLEQRNRDKAIEKEISEAHRDFHSVITSGGGFTHPEDAPRAVAYFNILGCLIPDLVQAAKKIETPPDSGPIVEAIYRGCRSDPSFADRIRGDCHARRNASNKRSADFQLVARKMSGDERDLFAIKHCFSKANRGFTAAEERRVKRAFAVYKKTRSTLLASQ
jgi:hypothetical protein